MEDTATSSAHTKGPWRLEGPYRIHIDNDNLVEGLMVMNADERHGESFPIARVTGPSYFGREDGCDPELIANAAFIVRACNSHEALLDACKMLLKVLVQDCDAEEYSGPRKLDHQLS